MGTGKNVRKLNERGKKGGGSMGNGHQHLFMKHSTTTRKTQHSLQSVNYDDVYFIFSLTLLDVWYFWNKMVRSAQRNDSYLKCHLI